MTEQLKFLVQEFNKAPFNRNFNLITLDSLEPLRLLQLLSDVLCYVEERPSVDIQTEASDETAFRVFETLRILRYKPPTDPDELTKFRLGVVEGDKHSIFPVLVWLLQKLTELQKRAYLARFLVKVDVPPEFMADAEVEQLFGQCEQLMEEFKEIHKNYEQSKSEGVSSEEIRHDIRSMEQERDHLTKRIGKSKKKLESMPKKDAMLELAKQLRVEVEREQQLSQMKQEQRNGMVHAEQKLQRVQQQIKELRQETENARPEDLIQKLMEENKTHRYMVEDKLPKEIINKRKVVQELQKVMAQPAMDQNDLDQIRQKIDSVTEEVTKLIEQKNLNANPTDDKLAIFRQQANIVQRKKESAAEALQEARRELQQLEEDLKQKKSQMRDAEGNEIVTSVQFKNYVHKLRTKTNLYKKRRSELQDLKSEIGVLARTEEILKAQWDQAKNLGANISMEGSEDEENTVPVTKSNARPMTAARLAGRNVAEIASMVRQMTNRLESRKKTVAPMLQELRPLREQYQQISETHTVKKQQYDSTALSLESGYSRLEQEVRNLRQDMNNSDSLAYKLDTEKNYLDNLLELVKTDGSFKEKLQAKINEAEEAGKRLREEQRHVRDDQQDAAKQMKQFRDLLRLMQVKKACILGNLQKTSTPPQASATAPTPASSRAQSSKLERTPTMDALGGSRIGTSVPGSRMNSARPPSRHASGKSQE